MSGKSPLYPSTIRTMMMMMMMMIMRVKMMMTMMTTMIISGLYLGTTWAAAISPQAAPAILSPQVYICPPKLLTGLFGIFSLQVTPSKKSSAINVQSHHHHPHQPHRDPPHPHHHQECQQCLLSRVAQENHR